MVNLFVKTIPRPLNWMATGGVAALGIKIFLANRIPEAFDGAYEFGVVAEGLLASVLASYIFYLVVVHVKETKDRGLIIPLVTKWARGVVGDASGLLAEISKATNTQLSLATVTQQDIHAAFSKIDPNGQSPLLIDIQGKQYATWRLYFSYYRSRSKASITKIISLSVFIEAQFVALIAAIDDCTYFMVLEMTSAFPISNKDASIFSDGFFEYCNKCKSLQRYIEQNG